MKKFILMLAISLGGIFSAQAQTFDFSCATAASGDFTGTQVDLLVENGFAELSAGEFQIVSGDGDYYVTITPNTIDYQVTDDADGVIIDAASDTLTQAIVAAINAAAAGLPEETVDNGGGNGAGTNPDTDGDGFTDAEEVLLATYSHVGAGFVDGGNGSYVLNGTDGYHLVITIAEDGSFIMTEVGGNNAVWPNVEYPATLTLAEAITYSISYFDAQ